MKKASFKRPFSQSQLRENNLSAILNCLKAKASLSRAQLADLTELNKSTVSSLTDELLSSGLIQEVGLASSDGGRPGTLLEINSACGYAVGVEFGTHFVATVLLDLAGQVTARTEAPIDPTRIEQAMKTAVGQVETMLAAAGTPLTNVFGLGVALPGIIDRENGRLVYSPNTQWRQVPVRQIFKDAFHRPVIIENNANAAALGEHLFGAAQMVDNFIFVSIGKGIGAGLFLNGQLIRGVSGLSGEIGQSHVLHGATWLTNQDYPTRRRWDAFANKEALLGCVRAAFEQKGLDGLSGDDITISTLDLAAQKRDPAVLACMRLIGERIGLGIANLTHLLDPALILIGGELSVVMPHLLPHIDRVVQMSDLIERPFPTKIATSTFGKDAILFGAGTLIIQDVLHHPKPFMNQMINASA